MTLLQGEHTSSFLEACPEKCPHFITARLQSELIFYLVDVSVTVCYFLPLVVLIQTTILDH